MKVAVFSTKSYDKHFLDAANAGVGHELVYYDVKLDASTATLVGDAPAVCVFVHDVLDRTTLTILRECGVRLIALRCTGFNHVDLQAAGELGLTVVRVTAYSPYAVAEHAVGLILTLSRKYHRAYHRVRIALLSYNSGAIAIASVHDDQAFHCPSHTANCIAPIT